MGNGYPLFSLKAIRDYCLVEEVSENALFYFFHSGKPFLIRRASVL